MPDEGEKRPPEARSELLGALLVVHKRLKATLDTAETHMVESLRLYEEARRLEAIAIDLTRALAVEKDASDASPDTQREYPVQEDDLDDPW